MSRSIKRVLALRFGGMGDILMTTPSLRAISETFQTESIDFILGRGNRDALAGLPYIGEIIEFGPRGSDTQVRNFLPFLSGLRKEHYDLFINFQPSLKTSLMAMAVHAPHHLTFHKNRKYGPTGKVRHAIDDFSKELVSLGIPSVPNRRMDFFIPEAAFAYVRELLHAECIRADATLIVANPGGTREINRWPPAKFIDLLDKLAEEYPLAHFILTGGPDDTERAQIIFEGVKQVTQERLHNMARRLSIKETGALLARSAVFITVDTGPMHMASALGTPMVVLSGAADPARTGPLNPEDLVVIRRDLECVPCGDRSCRRNDIACMNGMEVDWVANAVRYRLTTRHSPQVPLPMLTTQSGIEVVTEKGLVPLR